MKSRTRLTWTTVFGLASAVLLLAQDQGQLPIFRGGTNLVMVDAYPRKKDGSGILEGMRPSDFEIREDGVLQKVEQFEFVRVEPSLDVDRRDPDGVDAMRSEAADPHNRVFVIYLDAQHVDFFGANRSREALLTLLNSIIGPRDLFGLMTWKVPVNALTLGHKSFAFEEQLRHWMGEEDSQINEDPYDDFLFGCFGVDSAGLKVKRRETRALLNLQDLVKSLGLMREARSTLIVVSDGWLQYGATRPPDTSRIPQVTNRGGRIGIDQPQPSDQYGGTSAACIKAATEINSHDNERHYRDLIDMSKRSNVVFYPIDPGGLRAPVSPSEADLVRRRVDSLRTLAENTGGIAVVDTNDLVAGARRIINDVSSYYLLGYYSTNTKKDGGIRRIDVRVKSPGIDVIARRSYVVEDAAAVARAAEAARKVSGTGPPPEVAEGVKAAMLPVARLDSSAPEMFVTATADRTDILVVAEVSANEMSMSGGPWTRGVAVEATATNSTGDRLGTATGTITAGTRSAALRIPIASWSGPIRISVTSRGQDVSSTEQATVSTGPGELLGGALVFRGMPSERVALTPVADLLFRRTERAHVEWRITGTLDHYEARLLDRRGQPLPVTVPLAKRDDTDGSSLIVDLLLAPLSPADYAIEVTATAGEKTVRRYVAIRVSR